MSRVIVHDNVLSDEDVRTIWFSIPKRNWIIQGSLKAHDPFYKEDSSEFLQCFLTEEEYYNKYIFSKIRSHLDRDYKISEIYLNGQWSGRDGTLHTDECTTTALIYIGPYNPEWGGFTQFWISDEDQYIIAPLQKRLVLFDSTIKHKGYSFSYQDCPMRVSLAYKLV